MEKVGLARRKLAGPKIAFLVAYRLLEVLVSPSKWTNEALYFNITHLFIKFSEVN